MVEKEVSENIKKVIPWSNGLGVYITKEAKEIGLERGDHVRLKVIEKEGEKKILIEKV